jgi:hypothetical protein
MYNVIQWTNSTYLFRSQSRSASGKLAETFACQQSQTMDSPTWITSQVPHFRSLFMFVCMYKRVTYNILAACQESKAILSTARCHLHLFSFYVACWRQLVRWVVMDGYMYATNTFEGFRSRITVHKLVVYKPKAHIINTWSNTGPTAA